MLQMHFYSYIIASRLYSVDKWSCRHGEVGLGNKHSQFSRGMNHKEMNIVINRDPTSIVVHLAEVNNIVVVIW